MQEIGRDVLQLKRKMAEGMMTPLREILTDKDVKAACHAVGHRHRERIFTPLVTLWGVIGQSLDADQSCRAAVARILATMGMPEGVSGATGSYCEARSRLPERLIEELVGKVARRLEARVPPEQLWLGLRKVRLVDGTCFSMSDTPGLLETFGLPPNTTEGVGFPVARAVGMVSWSTGAVVGAAIGAYRMHERHLFRETWGCLDPGDVVAGDSGFGSYAEIALLKSQEVDCVFRINNTRNVDFRLGKRLGEGDHLVTWKRPAVRPAWLPKDIELPDTITVREIRFTVEVPGFRPEEIVLATTLLDPKVFPKEEIATLFRSRWEIEIDFRHIKITMEMDVLRGKSPDIVKKEFWAHLLAYNLIRSLMFEAGKRHQVPPLRISFKGAIQRLLACAPFMTHAPTSHLPALYLRLLDLIARDILPDRPGRVEPRCVKRHPKSYPFLTVPRHVARLHLLQTTGS